MRPSVHKLLVHGCEIAKQFKYPQIYYAEDGLEHSYKLNRNNSSQHARQNSRLNRIIDMADTGIYSTARSYHSTPSNIESRNINKKNKTINISNFLLLPTSVKTDSASTSQHNRTSTTQPISEQELSEAKNEAAEINLEEEMESEVSESNFEDFVMASDAFYEDFLEAE